MLAEVVDAMFGRDRIPRLTREGLGGVTLLQSVNRAMLLMIIGGAVFAGVQAVGGPAPKDYSARASAPLELPDRPALTDGPAVEKLMGRNFFEPLFMARRPPPAPPIVPPPPPKIPLAQRASHLRLVGVIPGERPVAVVEDQRSNAARHVSAGDHLEEIQIESVSDDKVILMHEGERLALGL